MTKGATRSADGSRSLWEKMYLLGRCVRTHIPFFYYNIALRSMDRDAKTLLDVGCGEGRAMSVISKRLWELAVGVDIFRPYIERCRRELLHHAYVVCDVRALPFRSRSFDVVICFEVLEHLEKGDGLALVRELERVARSQVMVSTPVGFQEQGSWHGNPFEVHRSGWLPGDLTMLGYRVRGTGLRGWAKEDGPFMLLPRRIRESRLGEILFYIVWIAAGPISHFAPRLGGNMIGVRDLTGRTASDRSGT